MKANKEDYICLDQVIVKIISFYTSGGSIYRK